MPTKSKRKRAAQNRRYWARHRQKIKERRALAISTPEASSPEVLGIAKSYVELTSILRRRREEKGMSQLELDDAAGMQSGYTGKLEMVPAPGEERKKGARTMGRLTTERWLTSLGVKLVVVEDPPPGSRRAETAKKPSPAQLVEGSSSRSQTPRRR